jgi:hypothetical protein
MTIYPTILYQMKAANKAITKAATGFPIGSWCSVIHLDVFAAVVAVGEVLLAVVGLGELFHLEVSLPRESELGRSSSDEACHVLSRESTTNLPHTSA